MNYQPFNFTFTNEDDGFRFELKTNEVVLFEVIEQFVQFLKGCGYVIQENHCPLCGAGDDDE